MAGNGLELVVGKVRQMLTCKLYSAVPSVRELMSQKSQFVTYEGTVEGRVVSDEGAVTDEQLEAGPDFRGLRLPSQHDM